ncbi:TetR/AcrR family transcriptional regulator [Methanobrevibacter sp.]|uniref:TetR/AcrR family transcriptional regulator n=1 Tax=Methanobrevibacter sp. TaxID=66852 RepID=UPI0038902BA8
MKIEEGSTEEKILKATFNIIESEGIEKATTKRIATEASVNEVTIFRKFKNKQNLINTMKKYYIDTFTKQLESVFSFEENNSVEEYFKRIFEGLLSTPQEDVKILKVALADVNEEDDRNQLITIMSDAVLGKLWEFFSTKIKQKELRDVDANILAVICYDIIFHSLMLWRIYGRTPKHEMEQYADKFYDILFNGIKA